MNKKTLLVLVSVLALLLAGGIGTGYAAVSGPCADCHTMHNSQAGAVMITDTAYGDAGYGALTRNTCLGCHTTTGADPLDANGYPYVEGAFNETTGYLAGGYFTGTGASHDDMSHTLGRQDEPAGYSATATFYEGETDGLSCAGASGCHGEETISSGDQARAIQGGHHGNNATLGYRMLCVGEDKVSGTGASDYEEALINSPSADDPHNYYSAGTGTGTISKLCGKCHGDFHVQSGSSGEWTRHPTDYALPGDWEIVGTYDFNDWVNNPVGTVNAADPGTGGTGTYVTCLSCHRAHGTTYADILRWDYAGGNQQANSATTTGCLGCHNKQRS